MGLLTALGLGSNLKKSERYKKKIEATPSEPLRNAVRRYIYSIAAHKAMEDYYNDVALGKGKEYGIEDVQAMINAADNDKWVEERRLRNYYRIDNPELLLPDRTKPLKYGGCAFVVAAGLGILGAAGLYISDQVSRRAHYKEVVNILAPEVENALKTENLDKAKVAYKSLVDKRDEWLPRKDYPEVWNKTEENERFLRGLERFLNAKLKFNDAEKAANEKNYAEALALIEDVGGVNAVLGGIGGSDLPDYMSDKFNDFVKKVKEFSGTYAPFRASFVQFNPIKNDIERLKAEVASLEEMVKKNELFDLDKANNVVDTVRTYLLTLRNVKAEAVGKADLEKVMSELKAVENLIEGRKGLLTSYELVKFNRVNESLKNVNTAVAKVDYLNEDIKTEIAKLNGLLEKAKSDSMQIDNSRANTFNLVSEITTIEGRIKELAQRVNEVEELRSRTKSDNLDESVKAASELVRMYFEVDSRNKKWDRISKVVNAIPEHKREVVENITTVVDLESKLLTDAGKMFVKGSLTASDLVGYNIAVSVYTDKKDDSVARNAAEGLLKEADLKEGRDVVRLLDELNGLRDEKGKLERLGEIKSNAEMENKRKEKMDTLSKEIEATEISVKIALEKFGDAAKTYLESGDKILNPSILLTLSNCYSKLGKRDIAEEYDKTVRQLKEKYKIE